MSFEVPYDQIRQLQISLRKEAGLESYKDDSQLPDLPSFEDSISQLYPSPQYLRCKHCKATLIRGINSVVCVFCGRQQNNDVPPDPIKLTSTSGYRWFLHSLDLDGSELVGPLIEVSQSNQGQITPEVDLPLSDLLDLEIRWPSEPKRSEFTSVSEREQVYKLSNVNVAGVDLDNFFTEAKADNVSVSTDEHITRNKHEDGTETNAFQGRESLSLFENVKPSETVAITEEAISGDSISGWEANFQSAGFGTLQENKLSDPFVGSSSVDLSSHMDAVFGSGKDLFDEKREGTISSISNKNDWFEDPWNNSNSENRDYQFEVPPSNKDQEVIGKTIDSSSSNADWIQGDQWMTGNSGSAATDNRIIDEEDDSIDEWNDFTSSANANGPWSYSNSTVISRDVHFEVPINDNDKKAIGKANDISFRSIDEDDSFDAWNDFTSSNAKVPFSNSLKDVNPIVSSVDQASEVNLLGGSSISKNVDFGSFPELDFFSTTMNKPNSSMETNSMSPESFAPDKMISMTGGIAEEVDVSGNLLNGSVESEVTGIERLMSQMHDLSFMLESNLSVPQKRDPENIDTVSSFSEN
ncbi:dentin sialophosphoprotein-related [Euphorbia peplus]|nr:dentin sialophosphoprotein-related [Euphorbia peplus]